MDFQFDIMLLIYVEGGCGKQSDEMYCCVYCKDVVYYI